MKTRIIACIAVVALVAGAALLITPHSKVKIVHAQVATVVGQAFAVNQFTNGAAGSLAGAVTNPSSNFVINIAGGPIFVAGSVDQIAQSTMTLSANTTNLLVWNGGNAQLYAKQAVTGPGSQGTNAINGPGVPTSLLFANPPEIPLATVVCNATACGNGGNGSITDARPLSAFPAGQYVGGHLNSTVAGTTAAMAFQGTCTLSSNTCTMTFTNAFQSAPVCVATDQTTPQLVKAPATTASVIVTDTVGATDVVSVICVGNPN